MKRRRADGVAVTSSFGLLLAVLGSVALWAVLIGLFFAIKAAF